VAAKPNAWQEKCTQLLLECVELGHLIGAAAWHERRKVLAAEAQTTIQPPSQARVIIADCSLVGRDLRGFGFQFCYLARVDFTDADLRGCDFDRAALVGSRLVRADLRGAKFLRTKIGADTLGWHVKIDSKTVLAFTGGLESLSGFDLHFRRRADEDQKIADIGNSGSALLRAWYWLIDYGRSLWRVSAIFLGVALTFALIYRAIYARQPGAFEKGDWTTFDFLIMSIQRFLNAPPVFGGKSTLVQSLFAFEAAIGYGALALLAAVLLRKLVVLK
jgi:hypothetical protein